MKKTNVSNFSATLFIILGFFSLLQSFPFRQFVTEIASGTIISSEGYVRIIGVSENSPASLSGLRIHDELVSINGTPVHTASDFIKLSRESKGTLIDIRYLRDGKEIIATLTSRNIHPPTEGPIGIQVSEVKEISASKAEIISQFIVNFYSLQKDGHLNTIGLVRVIGLVTSTLFIVCGISLLFSFTWSLKLALALLVFSFILGVVELSISGFRPLALTSIFIPVFLGIFLLKSNRPKHM